MVMVPAILLQQHGGRWYRFTHEATVATEQLIFVYMFFHYFKQMIDLE